MASSQLMDSEVFIEPAIGEAHLSEIHKLAHAIWRDHYPGIITLEQIEYMLREDYSMDALRRDLTQSQIRFDCARIEGVLIGFSAYGPHPDVGTLMLHKLYVESAHRSRGCARKLVEVASDHARMNSHDHIVLRVNKGNRVAIAAYERMGFYSQGPIVTDIGGGFQMDDYLMQLDL
jgi:ribosomal protein S18 acetylase RimI-like enzyme